MEPSSPKIGLFVWDQGARLQRALDMESLLGRLGRIKGVSCCSLIDDPWDADKFSQVAKGFQDGAFDRILWVGSFTSEQKERLKEELAQVGLNPYLQDWCDLQEQGICRADLDPDVRAKKALVLLQMALARVRLLEPLYPVEVPASQAVLIVGAGVAGLHAAVSLVDLGKEVHLVEKESGVGGKVALLHRFYPKLCDPICGLEFAVQHLVSSRRVRFHTLTSVISVVGGPGSFQVVLRHEPRFVKEARCNGCGECMGACPVEMEVFPGALSFARGFPSDSQKLKAIHPSVPMPFPRGFVVERTRCPNGCRECEKACPNRAVDLDEEPSEEEIVVGSFVVATGWDPYPVEKVEEYGYGLYQNVITNLEMERLLGLEAGKLPKEIGFVQCVGSRDQRHLPYCSSVCCLVSLKQALNVKQRSPESRCYLFYQDIRCPGFGEEIYQKLKEMKGVTFVRGIPSMVRPDMESAKVRVRVEDTLSGKEVNLALDLLVLAGGMTPSKGSKELAEILKLPRNTSGFFEAHLQCHPEESQRTGIYVGGCAREPMGVASSIDSAKHAAMEASRFAHGTILVKPTYPVVDKTKCDKCKRCVEECPFGSFYFDEEGFPTPHLSKCRHCGNCVGICPLGGISLRHLTIKQMASKIQAASTRFMDRSEPTVFAFLCENDAYHAAREAVEKGIAVPFNVIFVKVPCAGYVNNALIADALALGIDGVLIGACEEGQCHFVRGNELVRKRGDDLSDKLQKMMIERDRVRVCALGIREFTKYAETIHEFVEDLRMMGPNPFKR